MTAYQQNIGSIIQQLESNANLGLDSDTVGTARKKYGPNVLKSHHSRNILEVIAGQFSNMLVVIFIITSLLDFYLGQRSDAAILMAIVLVNAAIGVYQELKSDNILASLKKLVVEMCKVIRDGKLLEITVNDVVPGDLVQLLEGEGVPADIRLIQSNELSANEFIITGESIPSDKDANFLTDKNLSLPDIKNCVFMGTTIARGEGRGIVYATGMKTEIGKISSASQKVKTPATPTQLEAIDIGKKVFIASMFIGITMIFIRLLLHDPLLPAIVFSVGVAAAMIPEGLPAQISTALALGVQRLSEKSAVVKRIAAVENLGAATVIASDKTGTITVNEMTITNCHFNGMKFQVSGIGYEPKGSVTSISQQKIEKDTIGNLEIAFMSGYLSSTGKINPPDHYHQSWYCIGDPTEAAFSTLVLKCNYSLEEIDKAFLVKAVFNFDSKRKRNSIIRSHNGKEISFVKGAIESIISVSNYVIVEEKVISLSEEYKKKLLALSDTYAAETLRILAVAYKHLDHRDHYNISDAESDLTFIGFTTMLDPPHEEVKQAISAVFLAGIKLFMITGDNAVTAKAIASKVGLLNEDGSIPDVVTGDQLAEMKDDQLMEVFKKRAVIFSRVSSEDKFRIVDLLKKQGEIVAVTGDGVNDTLSLKRADMGVAMGKNGSKVAQEAAAMILLDDNFSTIVTAIKEGRTIFRNIEKTVITNLSSNIAELIGVLFGFISAFWGLPTPILVMQILAIDMLGEMFPLIALTYDPPEENIMLASPRNPKSKILTRVVLEGIFYRGLIMGFVAYCAFLISFLSNHGLAGHYEKATTVMYASIILGQYANLLSNRTQGDALGPYLFSNKQLLRAFALSVISMLLIIYLPILNFYFHTRPLTFTDWLLPFATGAICLLVYEQRKKLKQEKLKLSTAPF